MKYLGLYTIDYIEDDRAVIVPENEEPLDTDTRCNYYYLDDIMRADKSLTFPFDGYMTISNTGGIVVQILNDEAYKVWIV